MLPWLQHSSFTLHYKDDRIYRDNRTRSVRFIGTLYLFISFAKEKETFSGRKLVENLDLSQVTAEGIYVALVQGNLLHLGNYTSTQVARYVKLNECQILCDHVE